MSERVALEQFIKNHKVDISTIPSYALPFLYGYLYPKKVDEGDGTSTTFQNYSKEEPKSNYDI